MAGYIIWICCALIFVGIGISDLRAETPVHIWTVSQEFEVTDVKKYNRAVAILWFILAGVMVPLGLPLFDGQNKASAIIPILGMMGCAIAFMVAYVFVEKKYRVKK